MSSGPFVLTFRTTEFEVWEEHSNRDDESFGGLADEGGQTEVRMQGHLNTCAWYGLSVNK